MSGLFGGPMFERDSAEVKSVSGKVGAHYNVYAMKSVAGLKQLFGEEGEANTLNFCLFSTSGVHGSYTTLEQIEASLLKYGEREFSEEEPVPEDYTYPHVTVLVVQPRIVCLRYADIPVTLEDMPFLKRLRASSWAAVQMIGAASVGEES